MYFHATEDYSENENQTVVERHKEAGISVAQTGN